jgi:hypothetical protein
VQPATANKRLGQAYLRAQASPADIQESLLKNYGDTPERVATVSLEAKGAETRVMRKFQDAALVDAYVFQVRLGDIIATDDVWELDDWIATLEAAEQR